MNDALAYLSKLNRSHALLIVALGCWWCSGIFLGQQIHGERSIFTANLLQTDPAHCIIDGLANPKVRLIAQMGPIHHPLEAREPIRVSISADGTPPEEIELVAKTSSGGGKARRYGTYHYSIIQLPAAPRVSVTLSSTHNKSKLKQLTVKLQPNPSNTLIHLASVGFVIFLMLATYTRQRLFRGKRLRWVPYLLAALVSTVVLFWNT